MLFNFHNNLTSMANKKTTNIATMQSIALLIVILITLQGCAALVVTTTGSAVALIHDRRSLGAIIDDQSIELKASMALRNDKDIQNQGHINVTSYNGTVLITGEILTEAIKDKVSTKIEAIDRVVRVYNELMIAAPSSLPSRSSDTWITSKVKTKLIANEKINPLYVKIVTERGIVYLMGKVSHAEADKIVDITAKSDGVQKVIRLFEYTD